MTIATLLKHSRAFPLRPPSRVGLATVLFLCATVLTGTAGAGKREARQQDAATVIPAPVHIDYRPGRFSLGADTRLAARTDAARAAAQYFARQLARSGGPHLEVGRGGAAAPAIEFRVDDEASTVAESYRIEVEPAGVVVSARGAAGLFYGAVTLGQLSTAGGGTATLPALSLSDYPRFRWRGLMLDSARHFQSPQFVMRYLDWMALHKLNVFSWHLTDDQAWRLEIRRYPRLTQVGAWRVPEGRAARKDIDPRTGRPRLYGGFYSRQDVRRIVAHAAALHITIVPEIDLPGHSTAAIVAYPELASTDDPPRAVPSEWGVFPNLVNVEEPTFAFFEHVLDEVMELFPGPYVHLGGDEAVKDQWHASARIQARMRELHVADETALQGYFTARLGAYLRQHGRRLVGWDEILEGGVPPDAVVMSWRGVSGAQAAAARGHDAVLSPDPILYLDNRQGTAADEPPGRGNIITSADIYGFDPLPGVLAADPGRVLGVQANLWTEHVRTEASAAYMSFPRAAALAEVAWSAAPLPGFEDFRGRLLAEFARYRALGLNYSPDVFRTPRPPGPFERHMSQDLKTCTNKLVLNQEDDAPPRGPRAVFLVDIMNPCWIFPGVALDEGPALDSAVGQLPFNFQIGADRNAIHFDPPRTAAGELEVRVDDCSTAPVLVLPLAAAQPRDTPTVLPPARLPRVPGRHDLCFRFTQAHLDPFWVLDWVQVSR